MKNCLVSIWFCLGIFILHIPSFAQEQLLPLRYNPMQFTGAVSTGTRNAVTLPFIDDFSYAGPNPDASLWENRGSLVNLTFPKDPVTYGVVTLDGLNGQGVPYDTLSYDFSSIGPADTLASMPVLLGNLDASDSVYFSFYYQPGGLGDVPNNQAFNSFNYGVEFGDSLVLEFKDNTGAWHPAWKQDGSAVHPFRQVMVGIISPGYFHDDFQFRFRNYASLIGNYDQWHIDYVRLNAGRSRYDTLITDVSVQLYPTSFLKTYQAMPWNQFQNYQEEEVGTHHLLAIKNNFNAVKNTSYHFDVTEKNSGTFVFASPVQSKNISASDTSQVPFAPFDIPDFFEDTVVISSRYVVGATGDNNTRNDTITRDQVFSNFMAYDDGSAEATYRLLGTPAYIAQRYVLNVPDTLQGIEIHFTNTDENMDQNLFSLLVWSNLNVDDTLYRDDFLKPKLIKQLNGFAFYRLDRKLVVSDTFYIGFQQTSVTADIKTDIGFDLNTDGSDHLFYNVNGTWNNSQFKGSLMMRPVLGNSIPFQVGISESSSKVPALTLFPNPVHDVLNLIYEYDAEFVVEIFDHSGRLMLRSTGESAISVRELPAGFYILKVTARSGSNTAIQKFIKQ